MPPHPEDRDDRAVHNLKNQLAIIIGFSDLMLSEMHGDDPHRNDANEINKAAHVALEEVRSLSHQR